MGGITDKNQIIVPFLKWAGGKRWLVSQYPEIFSIKYKRYIEPFVGSGAVFFYLKPKIAVLSDTNSDLIVTYKSIKKDWKKVTALLKAHSKKHSADYYYKIRSKSPDDGFELAARFLYLNRTCWNGLYRVNLRGEFNVPIGTKSTVLLDSDNFEAIASILKNARLDCWDFENTIARARSGDLLFVDPPYTVKHNHNGFIKYNQTLFSWDDQVRLFEALRAACSRGAKIIATNADHGSVRRLYQEVFQIKSICRKSVIAGKSEARGDTTELLILHR